jgi:hypothetical protein
LLDRARSLSQDERWALIEDLDPDISHFEFFLSKGPLQRPDWGDDSVLLAASGQRNRCLWGWPSTDLLGPDLLPLTIEPAALALMQAVEAAPGMPLADLPLPFTAEERCGLARRLMALQVLQLVA